MSRATKNFVLFACGRKGSGKSHLLHEVGRRFPRRIIFDPMSELEDTPAAVTAYTLASAIAELKRASKRTRWTILCPLVPDDTVQLIEAIAPPHANPRDSFTYKVGGVVIEHGEVDQIAPPHAGISQAVVGMLARGRHYRISALVGSRRPAECHKIITSQADVIAAFTQHEPRDVDYLERTASHEIGRFLTQLKEYEYARLITATRQIDIVDAHGRVRTRPSVQLA